MSDRGLKASRERKRPEEGGRRSSGRLRSRLAMRFLLLLAGLALLTASMPVRADEAADHQDLVLLTDAAPVLVRLHIRSAGKSFRAAWNDFLDRLFAFVDRDGDDSLNEAEVGSVPRAQVLTQMRQNGYQFLFTGRSSNVTLNELDTDRDGKVSRAELHDYYRRNNLRPFQMTQGMLTPAQNTAMTDALYRRLDTDGDGKLSKVETLAGATMLFKLDADDDETVSPQELTQTPNPLGDQFLAAQMMRAAPQAGPANVLDPDDPAPQNVFRLMQVYDKDENQHLSRSEVALARERFDALDVNQDGDLAADELVKFLRGTPDLELVVRLVKVGNSEPGVERHEPTGPLSAAAQPAGRAMLVTLGTLQVQFGRVDATPYARNRQVFLQQFQAADMDSKGFLDKKDVEQRQYRIFQSLFPAADRDDDGKVTEKEFTGYLDLLEGASESFTSLVTTNQGQGLFELFDADRDGRLGVRELRTAWERLAAKDMDKDDGLARSEIPRQLRLTVARGPQAAGPGPVATAAMDAAPRVSVPTRGPLWFRKMDRNADGDVSRREFLGTADDFKRLDADNDGLLSAREAAAARKP